MSDTISETEKLSVLWKHLFGKPATSTSREFFQEPNLNSRPFVYQEDIVSYKLPSSAPTDLQNLTDTSLDDNGNVLKGSYAGKTSSIDSNVRYYHKIPLEAVVGTGGSSFQSINASCSHPDGYADGVTQSNTGVTNSYGRVLQNSIPFNQAADGSYLVSIFKSSGVAIPFGTAGGGWVVDPRPGVVTFYAYNNLTGVSESYPISVSFYRYVGATGGVSSQDVQSMISGQTTEYTVKQVFTGGDGSTGDQLTAVQIDTRGVSSLAEGALLDSLQWGGNEDGSWRVTVQKTQTGSKFLIQSRVSGVWVTKSCFTSP